MFYMYFNYKIIRSYSSCFKYVYNIFFVKGLYALLCFPMTISHRNLIKKSSVSSSLDITIILISCYMCLFVNC